jgi:hypothetical protein
VRRKAWWWAGALSGPVIMFGLALFWAAIGLWPSFVASVVSGLIFTLFIGLNLANFRWGYRRGQDDFVEALVKSESRDEFVRLMNATPPRPWQ